MRNILKCSLIFMFIIVRLMQKTKNFHLQRKSYIHVALYRSPLIL